MIVSFATPDYLLEACSLVQSLEVLGYDYRVAIRPGAADWERTCALKAQHMWEAYRVASGPVWWIDADAVVRRPLGDGFEPYDVAFHRFGSESCSGTVWVNKSVRGYAFLAHWRNLCTSDPTTWDQRHLDRAVEFSGAALYELPPEYCWIDTHSERRYPDAGPPVIYHNQASRRRK